MLIELVKIVKVSEKSNTMLCDLSILLREFIVENSVSNLDKAILTYDRVYLNRKGNELIAKKIIQYLD